jgi:hypothetical protein
MLVLVKFAVNAEGNVKVTSEETEGGRGGGEHDTSVRSEKLFCLWKSKMTGSPTFQSVKNVVLDYDYRY